MQRLIHFAIVVACIHCNTNHSCCHALQSQRISRGSPAIIVSPTLLMSSSSDNVENLMDKATRLRQQANDIRSSLPPEPVIAAETQLPPQFISEWTVASSNQGVGYRLQVDFGREPGTWMDPRWGASGKRIELAIDIFLCSDVLASSTVKANMVKDNFGGKSSPVYLLESAKSARLRNGFDKMKCSGGGYRVDMAKDGQTTLRFYVDVEGKEGAGYGDISVPKGCIYFSLPCFGQGASQLSSREGLVSVRQIGWNTGFRREESRIVGTFRALPIEKAEKLNKY